MGAMLSAIMGASCLPIFHDISSPMMTVGMAAGLFATKTSKHAHDGR
jgi:hypothetical protein